MNDMRHGYTILTHDYRSPLQGGAPVWDGKTLPYTLPEVHLDTSQEECAAGWNYWATIAEAIPIAGLWPTGRPSMAFEIQASSDAIQRGDKRRASSLTLLKVCTEEDIQAGVLAFSELFTPHHEHMASEQMAWRRALERHGYDGVQVEQGLQAALAIREVRWHLRQFPTAWAACDACDARHAWAAKAAWAAMAPTASAWANWAAWDARDALLVCFASRQQAIPHEDAVNTVGIRAAYHYGAEIVVPVDHGVLGWAMRERIE